MDTEIRNSQGERIDYTFDRGSGAYPDWVVVLGHGVTGDKERPIVADTAAALNLEGFDTLRFSFSGNGDSEGLFTDSTISKEVQDLGAVLDNLPARKICYIGHSMGAAVGVLVASKDKRISRLVSLAGMVDTHAFATVEFGEETPDTGLMWEEESCPLSQKFMDDLCETVKTVLPAAKTIEVPWLLVHGSADDVVLIRDSESVQEALGGKVSFQRIEGGDHSFNGEQRNEATRAVTNWLVESLAD